MNQTAPPEPAARAVERRVEARHNSRHAFQLAHARSPRGSRVTVTGHARASAADFDFGVPPPAHTLSWHLSGLQVQPLSPNAPRAPAPSHAHCISDCRHTDTCVLMIVRAPWSFGRRSLISRLPCEATTTHPSRPRVQSLARVESTTDLHRSPLEAHQGGVCRRNPHCFHRTTTLFLPVQCTLPCARSQQCIWRE